MQDERVLSGRSGSNDGWACETGACLNSGGPGLLADIFSGNTRLELPSEVGDSIPNIRSSSEATSQRETLVVGEDICQGLFVKVSLAHDMSG